MGGRPSTATIDLGKYIPKRGKNDTLYLTMVKKLQNFRQKRGLEPKLAKPHNGEKTAKTSIIKGGRGLRAQLATLSQDWLKNGRGFVLTTYELGFLQI